MKYNVSMNKRDNDFLMYQSINLLAGEYRHYLLKLADSFHLSASQLHSLMTLEPSTPVPMKYLCKFLSCDASYITIIIDRLIAESLIERHESQDDRRIKMITLTKKGEHVRQLAISHLKDIESTGISQLTPAEKEQLAHLLTKATGCPEQNR